MRPATHSLGDRMRVITIIMLTGAFSICTAQDLPTLTRAHSCLPLFQASPEAVICTRADHAGLHW